MQPPPTLHRDRVAILAALVGPLLISVVLVPFRDSFANTDAALVLVVVIVAIAANGYRLAGVLAAVSAAVWFDFFLAVPYERFAITRRADIETAVLLLVVGIGVSELAVWGRRQHALARERAGYLTGIHAAAEAVATRGSATSLIERVRDQLILVLDLRECHFEYGRRRARRPAAPRARRTFHPRRPGLGPGASGPAPRRMRTARPKQRSAHRTVHALPALQLAPVSAATPRRGRPGRSGRRGAGC